MLLLLSSKRDGEPTLWRAKHMKILNHCIFFGSRYSYVYVDVLLMYIQLSIENPPPMLFLHRETFSLLPFMCYCQNLRTFSPTISILYVMKCRNHYLFASPMTHYFADESLFLYFQLDQSINMYVMKLKIIT
ncbi:hypothetical protein K7432_012834 [Basidiobolus ranarum]|uniref:Uncharacterized protein n=1 Tax=Basidiobolus ranarum TaxID=34480 RepID=A0ABR2VRU4_9FUNG